MNKLVTVIDYGMGNVLSVRRAFEAVGAKVIVTDNLTLIKNADRLVLPGVGAFADCMSELINRGLVDVIRSYVQSGNSLLGICVGMQTMLDSGEEHGTHLGLGIIPGHVTAIPKTDSKGSVHNVPHIGWAEISLPNEETVWDNTILHNLTPETPFYFVHSFTAVPDNCKNRLADCFYNGRKISAAITKENVTGLQFHPEKSGHSGLRILSNYLRTFN